VNLQPRTPNHGAGRYLATQVQASTPLEQVVLLYDAAVRSLQTARDAMGRQDIRARRDALNRAIAVIGELHRALDMKRGGEIAANLDRLYTYVRRRIMQGAVTRANQPLDDALAVLMPLRDTWRIVAKRMLTGSAA
jgi:flagellar protein FliS